MKAKWTILTIAAALIQPGRAGGPEGTWNVFYLVTPQSLPFDSEAGRFRGGYDFEVGHATAEVGASGDFGGGTVTFAAGGAVSINQPGMPLIRLWRNANEDVLTGCNLLHDPQVAAGTGDGDIQRFDLILKAPETLTDADVTGTWYGVRMQVPETISFPFDSALGVNVIHGGYDFDSEEITAVLSPGDFSISGKDTVTVGSHTLKINASKTVMAFQEVEPGIGQSLGVFVKQSATAMNMAEISGKWLSCYFQQPVYFEAYHDAMFAPHGGYQFGAGREAVAVSPFGGFSGDGGRGTLSHGAEGVITVNNATDPPMDMRYSQDGQILLGRRKAGDTTSDANDAFHELTMAVRYERPFAIHADSSAVTITLPMDAGNHVLLKSTDGRTWNPITPSHGTSHTETPSGSALFRLAPGN